MVDFSSLLPAGLPADPALLPTLLDLLPLGVMYYTPVVDTTGTLTDLGLAYLNPAAQRMTQLPARPGTTYRQQFPTTDDNGAWEFHRRSWLSQEPQQFQFYYDADGFDSYFRVTTQRLGEGLLSIFTDTRDEKRSDVEKALHESQLAEKTARAEAETQRQRFYDLLMQLPAQVAVHEGPDQVFTLVNPGYQRLAPGRTLLGQPIREAWPELVSQGILDVLDQVYRTGEPFVGQELPFQVDFTRTGTLEQVYLNAFFLPLRDTQGQVSGILDFSVDVTTQVEARQQVELLNQELEARVQARTRELSEQQELLGRILGQVPAAVATFGGPEHRFTFFNEQYQALVQHRAAYGVPVAEAIPEVAEQGFLALFDQVYQSGQAFVANEQRGELRQPDGTTREQYFNFVYQPLRDPDDQVMGILAFTVEVSEQVRARQRTEALQAELLAAARRQAAEREGFYHVLEQAPVGVTLLRGPELRFEYLNPTFQRLFPDRSLLGLEVATAFPGAESQGFIALHQQVYRTGVPYFGTEVPFTEALVAGQPPRTTYFDFSYQALREHGETVGICAFAFDVTERVRARQERETRQGELQRLFEQAPVAIAVFRGPQYVIELANPSVCALWDRTPAQAVGTPLFELLPEAAGQGFEQLLDQVRATGEPFVAHELPASIDRHGRRETVYWNFVYAPLREADGRIERVTVVATDGTEQVLARQQVYDLNQELAAINEELRASNEELNESNRQLTRTNVDLDNFIYTASHDLKAPITNIEGLLLALEHELPAAGRTGDVPLMLTMMQNAVERFQHTINHLTDLSRLQKEYDLAAEAVALAPLVEAVRLDLTPLLAQTQGQLTVQIAEGLRVTFAEKNLRSVVYNLLSNAFKYRHPDRAPAVLLRSWPAAAHTVLEVQDNGLGLDLAQGQERLFAMFQRLHTHVEGTGVGLYMVKRIVENVGGRIEVESEPGQGSTFRVYFPN